MLDHLSDEHEIVWSSLYRAGYLNQVLLIAVP